MATVSIRTVHRIQDLLAQQPDQTTEQLAKQVERGTSTVLVTLRRLMDCRKVQRTGTHQVPTYRLIPQKNETNSDHQKLVKLAGKHGAIRSRYAAEALRMPQKYVERLMGELSAKGDAVCCVVQASGCEPEHEFRLSGFTGENGKFRVKR